VVLPGDAAVEEAIVEEAAGVAEADITTTALLSESLRLGHSSTHRRRSSFAKAHRRRFLTSTRPFISKTSPRLEMLKRCSDL